MSQERLWLALEKIDERFTELDYQRIAAINAGDLERAESIGEQQDALVERGESIRERLEDDL